jgi:hypothetical protein
MYSFCLPSICPGSAQKICLSTGLEVESGFAGLLLLGGVSGSTLNARLPLSMPQHVLYVRAGCRGRPYDVGVLGGASAHQMSQKARVDRGRTPAELEHDWDWMGWACRHMQARCEWQHSSASSRRCAVQGRPVLPLRIELANGGWSGGEGQVPALLSSSSTRCA